MAMRAHLSEAGTFMCQRVSFWEHLELRYTSALSA